MPEYLPAGVEYDTFQDWRSARKANGEDYTDAAAFAAHLAALGADNSDLHRWGFPVWIPAPEPPAPDPQPTPAPTVFDAANVDIGAQIAATAERYQIPPWSLHACLIAESGLNNRAERWGDSSTQGRALTGLLDADSGNEAALRQLQDVVDSLQTRGLGADISFGYSQLIVRTAGGYGIGDATNNLANILDVRRQLFDRGTSIDLGARHLALCYRRVNDELGGFADEVDQAINSLATYNSGSPKPAGSTYWTTYASNVLSYRRAIAQARPLWP